MFKVEQGVSHRSGFRGKMFKLEQLKRRSCRGRESLRGGFTNIQTTQSRGAMTDPAVNFALGINNDNAKRTYISRELEIL